MIHRVAAGAEIPGPDGFAFVASLGSAKSPRERHDPLVAHELDYIEACVDRDVPVLGLCFGGQALSVALGGSVEVLDEPELGWHTIETDAPELVAAGPWLQWHFEAFTTPPGAEELARSPACAQAFRLGPHLAVQFHPESTAEIVSEWARHDAPRLDGALDEHLRRLAETGRRSGADAERAAMRLFDGFWDGRGET